MKIILKQKNMPQVKNIKQLILLENQAKVAFKYIGRSIIEDILKQLKKDKLAKSTPKLPKGWTGEVSKISTDLGDIINPILSKHFKALNWLLYGDMAGKEAKQAAKDVGLKGKSLPGLLPSAYLQSIDAQREYFEEVIGREPPEIQFQLIRESLEEVMDRTKKFLNEFTTKFGNSLTESLQRNIDNHNYANTARTLEDAHENIKDGMTPKVALDEAIESPTLRLPDLEVDLTDVVDSMTAGWDRFAVANIGMASAVGTHQAVTEIFGREDGDMRVVLMTLEDPKVCKVCSLLSHDIYGKYIYYKMSAFKPSGYNYGRKQKDWQLTIPPLHPFCRCFLIYCPPGHIVNEQHQVVKVS